MKHVARDEKARARRRRERTRERRRLEQRRGTPGRLELEATRPVAAAGSILLGAALGGALVVALGILARSSARRRSAPPKSAPKDPGIQAGAVEVIDASGAHVRVIADGFEVVA